MEINDYKSKGFLPFCLEEIKLAYRDQIDPKLIEEFMNNSSLNNLQLRQIRLGLKDGIDVSTYARTSMPEQEMEQIRLRFLSEKDNKDLEAEKERKLEQEKTKGEVNRLRLLNTLNLFRIILIFLALSLLSVGVYFGKKAYDYYSQELFIEFVSEGITLEYQESFDPEKQIRSLPDIEGLVIIYPSFAADKLGEFDITYQIFNGFKSFKKDLHIRVADTMKPVIVLTQKEITLIRDEDVFIPEDYIKELSDNCDEEPALNIDDIDWELDEQEIVFTVSDFSGNRSEAVLTVFIEDKPKKETSYSGISSLNQGSPDTENSSSSGVSNSYGNSKPDPDSQVQPAIHEEARVYCHNVTVPLGTDPGTVAYSTYDGLSGNVAISIQYPELNTSSPGTYPIYYINTASGETMAIAYVTVKE